MTVFREILVNASGREDLDRKVREKFTLWEFGDQNAQPVLLTGYYEPVMEGSLQPGGEYRYPLYRRPRDLIEISSPPGKAKEWGRIDKGRAVPYYSRKEIDFQGALRGKGLEIVWLKDSWERFSLHIQGSGQVRLPDGRTMRVGFAVSNGRPYRSIGRYMVDRGYLSLKEVNLERVKQFIRENPDLAEEIYCANERYVFFREVAAPEGPLGAMGVPLTPGRSVASDFSIFPPGGLALLISREPWLDENGNMMGWRPVRRFVFVQDTGAAMKGPSRVDFFFGSGDRAGRAAGAMKEEGKVYFLLAK